MSEHPIMTEIRKVAKDRLLRLLEEISKARRRAGQKRLGKDNSDSLTKTSFTTSRRV